MIKLNLQMFADERPVKTKNANRKHYIAVMKGETKPTSQEYQHLARGITNIDDNSAEQTEESGDYAGDGTIATEVIGISEKWTFSGDLINDDPAQKIIIDMKREYGDKRRVWHKIVQTNGETYEGKATVSGIKTGGGEFSSFEEFACEINFDALPELVTP